MLERSKLLVCFKRTEGLHLQWKNKSSRGKKKNQKRATGEQMPIYIII